MCKSRGERTRAVRVNTPGEPPLPDDPVADGTVLLHQLSLREGLITPTSASGEASVLSQGLVPDRGLMLMGSTKGCMLLACSVRC